MEHDFLHGPHSESCAALFKLSVDARMKAMELADKGDYAGCAIQTLIAKSYIIAIKGLRGEE